MTDKIDEGKIWDRKEILVNFGVKGKELHKILINESIVFFKEKWDGIYCGRVFPFEQKVVTKYTREETNFAKVFDYNSLVKVEDFVLNLLANDFSPAYTSILKYGNKSYAITLDIKEIS